MHNIFEIYIFCYLHNNWNIYRHLRINLYFVKIGSREVHISFLLLTAFKNHDLEHLLVLRLGTCTSSLFSWHPDLTTSLFRSSPSPKFRTTKVSKKVYRNNRGWIIFWLMLVCSTVVAISQQRLDHWFYVHTLNFEIPQVAYF